VPQERINRASAQGSPRQQDDGGATTSQYWCLAVAMMQKMSRSQSRMLRKLVEVLQRHIKTWRPTSSPLMLHLLTSIYGYDLHKPWEPTVLKHMALLKERNAYLVKFLHLIENLRVSGEECGDGRSICSWCFGNTKCLFKAFPCNLACRILWSSMSV
jgi:hypothetical protein